VDTETPRRHRCSYPSKAPVEWGGKTYYVDENGLEFVVDEAVEREKLNNMVDLLHPQTGP